MNTLALPDAIKHLLVQHSLGVLATYGGTYPHTSLISLVFCNDIRHLLFPTLRTTRKYSNLTQEARVSVLIDNRSFESNPERLYAVTILGTARETDSTLQHTHKELLLERHPNLSDFLSSPETALIQVTLSKVILVEELNTIQEFDCPAG